MKRAQTISFEWLWRWTLTFFSLLHFMCWTHCFDSGKENKKKIQKCDCVQKNTLENCIKIRLKLVFFYSYICRGVMDRLARYDANRSFAHIIFEWYMQSVCIFQPIHIMANEWMKRRAYFCENRKYLCFYFCEKEKTTCIFFVCISTFV